MTWSEFLECTQQAFMHRFLLCFSFLRVNSKRLRQRKRVSWMSELYVLWVQKPSGQADPCNILACVFLLGFVSFIYILTNFTTHSTFFVLPTRYGCRPRVLPSCWCPGPCSLHHCLFCLGHRDSGSHRECLSHVCFFLVSYFPLNMLGMSVIVTINKTLKTILIFLCKT